MMAKMDIEREQDRQKMEQQTQYMRSLGISLEEIKDQNETLIEQNEELLDNNQGLKKDVKKVQRKLGIAVEDRAPQPEDESKRECFVLLKRNDPDYYPYYTIRAQNDYTVLR
jgi:DNA-binding transcriptional MerR regulator